jgi:4-amino-4-deoxy-L-arabinose transferase-like glycosyltransferase
LLVLLAAAAAVHMAVAVMDFSTLARNGFLYDDSFYAFQIARHVAEGHGPSFDGTHLTNGFQPLYVMLLVPLYWIAGSSDTLPVHAALILSALFSVASAYLLYRILVRRVRETAAIVAAGAWSFSPIVMRQTANGLETALAVFMLAATVLYYLEKIRPEARVGWRRMVAMGLLAGGCILARADLGFLVLAMCLDHLLVRRARRDGPGWRSEVAVAGATCLVVCLPWMIYGMVAVGSPFPESGRATRFLALAYAPFFNLGNGSMTTDGPTPEFVATHFLRSAETFKVVPVLHPVFRAIKKTGLRMDAAHESELVADAVGVVVLIAFGLWWWHRRRSERGKPCREFEFLMWFGVMMVAAYSSFVFGVFFFLRYYYPVYFIGMIFGGIAIHDAIGYFRRRSVPVRRAALAATGAYAAALLFMGYTSGFRSTPVYKFYDAARWVRTHTDSDDTIGVFQSGAIGYLSHRRVINLDGKVNREAFTALRDGTLPTYVASAGIDLLIDSSNVIDLFLGPWSDADRERLESERVFTGGEYGVPGWIGYRLSPPRVFNASGTSASAPRLAPDRAP